MNGGRSGEGPLQSYDGFFFISNYIAGNWLFYMNGDWDIYRLHFDGEKYILTYVTD